VRRGISECIGWLAARGQFANKCHEVQGTDMGAHKLWGTERFLPATLTRQSWALAGRAMLLSIQEPTSADHPTCGLGTETATVHPKTRPEPGAGGSKPTPSFVRLGVAGSDLTRSASPFIRFV